MNTGIRSNEPASAPVGRLSFASDKTCAPAAAPVLLVDDRRENLLALEHLLISGEDNADICCVKALSGNEALQKTREYDFALILLDVQMPVMDGFETAELLRSRSRTRHIPIIFITAISTDDTHLFNGYEKGAVDYLLKPVDHRILKSKVRVFVDLYRRNRELEETARELEETVRRLRRSERRLSLSEEKHRLLVENANDGIVILQKGLVCYGNLQAGHMFGCPVSRLQGHSLLTRVHPEDHDTVRLLLENGDPEEGPPSETKPAPATESDSCVFRCIRDDSTEIWVEAGMILTCWDQKPAKMVILRDINRQRMLEQQLRQSQKMEAIGTLAGGIAHDFNNLLGMIMGYAEIATNKLPDEALVRHNLKQILKAGSRAEEIVSQILTFSHKQEAEQTPVAIASLIRETIALMQQSLPPNVHLEPDIMDRDMTVASTPVYIHQILMNLGYNAFHAMESTGGTLKIRLRRVETLERMNLIDLVVPPGRYARLTVEDTGAGMDEETRKQIFEPYFTTKDAGKGTGMGLAVVHGIIRKSGGYIAVDSMPGRGTRFDIFFPLVDAAEASRPLPPSLTSSSLSGGMTAKGIRILLVDDETLLAELGEQMLENLGHHPVCYTDPVAALAEFRIKPDHFDMVITDMTMPLMSGEELLIEILRIRPDIPVIVSTGYHDSLTESRVREAGGRTLIRKPISLKLLSREIEKAFSPPADADDSVTTPPLNDIATV